MLVYYLTKHKLKLLTNLKEKDKFFINFNIYILTGTYNSN